MINTPMASTLRFLIRFCHKCGSVANLPTICKFGVLWVLRVQE